MALTFYSPDAVKLADQLEAVRTGMNDIPAARVAISVAGNLLNRLADAGMIPPREPKREVA